MNQNCSLAVVRRLVLLSAALAAAIMVAAGAADGPSTTLVSRALDGGPALTRADCRQSAISGDGRYVAFISNAVNLTPDANGQFQVFLRDTQTGAIEIVSRSSDGRVADASCVQVAISQDARYVAFSKEQPDLFRRWSVPPTEVFVRDRVLATTELVSAIGGVSTGYGYSGSTSLAITPDGRYVAFESLLRLADADQNHFPDVYLRDRATGALELMSVATHGGSGNASSGYGRTVDISDDGRVVAFTSWASDLVPLDRNGESDVFVRDRVRRLTERVSLTDTGAPSDQFSYGPSLSATGRFVAFVSRGDLSRDPALWPLDRAWLRDRTTQRTELVAVTSGEETAFGWSWNPTVSADGRYVAFRTNSTNVVSAGQADPAGDVIMRDRFAGTTTRIRAPATIGFGGSEGTRAAFSADNSRIAYNAPEGVVSLGMDRRRRGVILYKLGVRQAEIISSTPEGPGLAFARSSHSSVSADGRYIAFVSDAINLVPGDTNETEDVFVQDRGSGAIERVSVSSDEMEANGRSSAGIGSDRVAPSMSADGRYVAFVSSADNLVPGDINGSPDVFVRDRTAGSTELISIMPDGRTTEPHIWNRSPPGISGDGRYVTFSAPDPERPPDGGSYRESLFLRDRQLGRTERLSVTSSEQTVNLRNNVGEFYGRPSVSSDGRHVAFEASADLAEASDSWHEHVYVRDRGAGTTQRVSVSTGGQPADQPVLNPSISANGRFVVFESSATNLASGANGWPQVFLHDRLTRTTERVSLPSNSDYSFSDVSSGAVSSDGRFVAFHATARKAGTTTPSGWAGEHVWVRDRLRQTTELVSRWPYIEGYTPVAVNRQEPVVSLSPDGRFITFDTLLSTTPEGVDGLQEVFITDRGTALPAAPALTARPISPTEIKLTWRDLSTNESGFVVERRAGPTPGSGLFGKIATLDRNVTAYTSGGLYPGSAYTFRVRAFNWRGDSPNSNEASAVTLPPPPSAPINLTAQALSKTEIKLTWRDTSGTETGFKIERKGGVNGFFAQIGTVGANVTTFTSTGLFPGSTYSYRVRAHNAATNSAYSNVVEGTTPLR